MGVGKWVWNGALKQEFEMGDGTKVWNGTGVWNVDLECGFCTMILNGCLDQGI